MFHKFISKNLVFNLIFIITFSISTNTYINLENLNILFYILFHLSFIYYLFYNYHYLIYFLGFIYGILFDILLINFIGPHLICFLMLISIFIYIKKYLFLFSSYQISIVIFLTLITIMFLEIFTAYLLNNISFTYSILLKYFFISLIIFIPSIYFLNRLDR